jgi:hypothetical protein
LQGGIERRESVTYRDKLKEFLGDHDQHVEGLKAGGVSGHSAAGRTEVVDKHFFICATMVNHFVIPPVADEFERRPDVIRP